MNDLSARLEGGDVLLIDGATGTELEVLGVPMVDRAWCALASASHPEAVKTVHRNNIEAGAELIIANTFTSSRHILDDAGLGHRFEELNRVSIQLALEARDEAADELGRPPVPVAGSISTTVQGAGAPPLDVARTNFADQVAIQAEAGVDLFILEMMRDLDQTNVILDAVETTGLPVWVGFAAELDDDGDPCLIYRGLPLGAAIDGLADRDIELLAIMHTEVDHIDRCLDAVFAHWSGPVGVYAHTGYFERPRWVFNDTISPAAYAEAADRWLRRGVQVIGGCCGIRPDHVRLLRPLVDNVRSLATADNSE